LQYSNENELKKLLAVELEERTEKKQKKRKRDVR